MTRHIIRLAAAASFAAMLAGCAFQENAADETVLAPSRKTVHFTAGEISTKTAFGQIGADGVYPTLWTTNANVLISLNKAEKAETEAIIEDPETRRMASFDPEFEVIQSDSYKFYAISPASAGRAITETHGGWTVNIPAEQTPLEGSPDESAQIIVATSEALSAFPEKVDLYFEHLTAYGKLTIKGLDLGSASVSKVELAAEAPLAGEWFYRCDTSDGAEEGEMTQKGASTTLTLNTSSLSDIWFACAPADLGGKNVRFSVFTDDGKVYSKTIKFPAGRSFTAGRVAKFSVSLSGVQAEEAAVSNKVFQLVKNVSALKTGKEIIFVSLDGTLACGPVGNTGSISVGNATYKYILPVEVNAADGVIADPSTSQVFTLENGSSNGSWSFASDASSYLASTITYPNRRYNYSLTTATSKSGTSSWTVSIDGDGTASIVTAGTTSVSNSNFYGDLRMYGTTGFTNAGNATAGSADASTFPKVAIYMADYVEAGEADPILKKEEYGAYLADNQWVYEPDTDNLSREYYETTLTFGILSPFDNTILLISGIPQDASVLSAPFNISLVRAVGSVLTDNRTFSNVSVVKENGSKLWLSDSCGNGFIVKK